MNILLHDQKGVTVLEGLIALLLLAVISIGTFGVLLSASRKTTEPDIREEMILAVERANQALRVASIDMDSYTTLAGTAGSTSNGNFIQEQINALKANSNSVWSVTSNQRNVYTTANTHEVLATGALGGTDLTSGPTNGVRIDQFLPSVCDPEKSSFIYTVAPLQDTSADDKKNPGFNAVFDAYGNAGTVASSKATAPAVRKIRYIINCNGYQYVQ